MKSRTIVAALIACLLSAQTFEPARSGYRFQFPRDYFDHPDYRTEWWYYTGNLRSTDGHRYGFELTFFRQAVPLPKSTAELEPAAWRPSEIYMAHLALSDIDRHRFYHTERLNRAGPGLAGSSLTDSSYWNGNWRVTWTSLPGADQELQAVCDEFTLSLRLQPSKPLVVHGQDGVSRKGPNPGQASHYLSFTRMQAQGTLAQGSPRTKLEGTAWMDHEFFSEPADSDLVGWDWFAIQLDGNRELMLYQLRNRSGKPNPFSSGTYVDAAGASLYLAASDFVLTPGALWTSPHSGARYPVNWKISIPSLQLELHETTLLPDQELWTAKSITPSYWEGAVDYAGSLKQQPVSGVGYLEMTGYSGPVRLGGSFVR